MKTFERVVGCILSIGLFVFVALWAVPLAESAPPEKVSNAVYEELSASPGGDVYVIVVLKPVPKFPRSQMTLLQAAVTDVQDRVLSSFAAGEFALGYRYHTFSGMTGRVNSAGIAKLETHPDVVAVGLDAQGAGVLDVSVPFIGADAVQALGFTGQGITVAVLDTGIDTDHGDLSDNIAAGAWHFLDQGVTTGPGAEDDHGHGTNVSGIITSSGAVTEPGVAPDTDILAVKVLKSDGSGWVSDWIAGVDYVVANVGNYANLCAINMSLGTFTLYSACPCDNESAWTIAFQASVQAAKDAGIVTFAASGNDASCTSMSSPGCLSAAVAVAAVYDQDLGREPDVGTYSSGCFDAATAPDMITCFSNRSGCNELAAPGRRIYAPGMGGGASEYTGTSQATPHCAGVAALLSEAAGAAGTLSPDDIVAMMKATGHATTDPCGTSPNPIRVDAFGSICMLDGEDPVITCPAPITLECNTVGGVAGDDPDILAFLDAATATDDMDPDPEITNDAPGFFPVGTTTVTFTATDACGKTSSCSVDVTVVDTTPPEITIRLSRRVLWPPNHKMAFVRARVEVTDECCDNPTFTLLGITSNEPVNGKGDGNTAPDWVVLSPTRFLLRSERAGGGDGRIYTIRYRADDCEGNRTYARARVRVPHDHSGFAFASAGFTSDGIGFDLNLDRFALVIRSTEEEWVTDEYGNTYQVSEPFDATTVDVSQAYVGNINGVVLPAEVRQIDNNADGLMDLVLYYPAQDVNLLIDGSTPTYEDEISLDSQPGPVGLHYTDTEGVDYLVPNIFNLGEPVPVVPPIEIGRGRAPDAPEIPEAKVTELMPGYPNPFNPSTTIPFSLRSEEHVVLRIYDAQGKLVRDLKNEGLPPGSHQVTWDGRDNNGVSVATGVYFVRFIAGSYQTTQKIVMIK